MKKSILTLALFGAMVLLFTGCSDLNNPLGVEKVESVDNIARKGSVNDQPTIVEIASGNSDFSILVQAVVFAGLDGVLSGKGQFTVFAPTNDAFVTLLGNLGLTPAQLFAPGNEALVGKILKYHVIRGERFDKDIVNSSRVRTLAKEFAYIDGASIGNSTYGYANIVATNIDASNGVVHVLDSVILPPSLEL